MATANIKISQLPSLSTMTNAAIMPVVAGGVTYQITGANLQNYFVGTYGNANVVANLAALGTNPVSTTGNITGSYILGNGSQLTGLAATYGNANVAANLAAFANNPVSTTGNITGGYFIGNGSLLTGISAGANTGNVTFSGETVIGTGTSNLISGLYLAPSSSSANANMYLRVRGNINDEPTHIHFDTGNNAYYNQFIGDDNKYIQLANTGNIIINSNDGVGNSAQWIFAAAGETVFPTLTTQRGDNPSGTITGQTLLFGDPSQEAIISTADGTVSNENSQRLVINPGQGYDYGEGGDIYLWAGRGGDGSGSGGDIKIRGGQGGANTTGGSGGAGGYIRMEAGDAVGDGQAGYIQITGGYGNAQGGNVNISGGYGTALGGNVLLSSGGYTWTVGTYGKITLPFGASLNDTSGDSVAFGQNAGLTSQAQHAVAIGGSAGSLYQGEDSIAIGYQSGYQNQSRGVAIGYQAGYGGTLYRSVSDAQGGSGPVTTYFPAQAPNPSRLYVASTTNIETNQRVFGNNIQANTVVTAVYPGEDRVDITPNYTAAMSEGDPLTFVGVVIGVDDASNLVYPMRVTGTNIPANTFVQSTGCSVVTLSQYPTAPLTNGASLTFTIGQGAYSTAVGYQAGYSFQGDGAVAIGYSAGRQNQSIRAVAVGEFAGYSNQSANAVAVGQSAGEFTQAVNAVAVGYKAGYYQQSPRAVAIGEDAGYNLQGEDAVAIGQKAGQFSQGRFSVAIGNTAGTSGQGEQTVAIGYGTGLVSQQYSAVAIGANAASYNQGSTAVAIGQLAGNTSQGASAVAVGVAAGYNNQQNDAVAIGGQSGYNYQGGAAVAIGSAAGQGQGYSAVYQSGTGTEITITPNAYIQIGQRITGQYVPADTYVADIDGASLTLSQAITGTPAVDTVWTAWGQQGTGAVAVGQNAGLDFQGNSAVAIGNSSGSYNQSANAVAIGYRAGFEAQGSNAVAIGTLAGQSAQGNNSIILNATGVAINSTGANTFTVDPVRNDVANTGQVMFYNTTSKEITYGNTISVAGNVSTPIVYNNAMAVQGYDFVQMQYSNAVALPVSPYDIGTGSWFYLDPAGGSFESNVTGTLKTVVLGNDGSVSAMGNITGGNISTSGELKSTGTFLIGTQAFYPQGSDGFSVNENFNAGNSTVTAYHYTSGEGRSTVVFDTAVTGQFTTGFGATGTAATNQFVQYSENANTTWEWRKNVGISAPNLNGGTLIANINPNGNLYTIGTISSTGNITGGNIMGGANVNATTHTGTTVSVTANITGGNVLFGSGIVSGTGNITGGNVLGGANVNATTHTGTTVSVTGNITGGNLAISGNSATITSANYSVGYLNIPQISFAANATAALVDSGKHYYTTSASNLALTLADNSAVSWPVGTALSIVNRGTANVTVAPAAGVSLYLAGNSSSANRVVTTYGMATVMNVAANIWMISGTVV